MRPLLPFALLAFAACGPAPEPAKTLEQLAAEKCPKIHLDRLAGDWIVLTGDPKTRVRIVEKDGHYEAYYTGLYVSRLAFTGTRREADIQFDEVPTGRRKERIASGAEQAKRFYAEPSMRTCTLRIFPGMVDASGKEAIAPKPTEFTVFPEQEGVEFTFDPITEPVFLADAAGKHEAAEKELAELGEPKPDVPMGAVSAAAWSSVAADGDPACTYDLDAYFDGQPVEGGKAVAAGAPQGDWRPWAFRYDAPFSGNHSLEIHRYRTCGDGPRERLGVAGVEAILQ